MYWSRLSFEFMVVTYNLSLNVLYLLPKASHFFCVFQVTWCDTCCVLKNQDKKFVINAASAITLPMLRLMAKIIFFVNIWNQQTSNALIVRKCLEIDHPWTVIWHLAVNNKGVLIIQMWKIPQKKIISYNEKYFVHTCVLTRESCKAYVFAVSLHPFYKDCNSDSIITI